MHWRRGHQRASCDELSRLNWPELRLGFQDIHSGVAARRGMSKHVRTAPLPQPRHLRQRDLGRCAAANDVSHSSTGSLGTTTSAPCSRMRDGSAAVNLQCGNGLWTISYHERPVDGDSNRSSSSVARGVLAKCRMTRSAALARCSMRRIRQLVEERHRPSYPCAHIGDDRHIRPRSFDWLKQS